MQQGNFIHVFLARHVSRTYAHNQEHQTLDCSIWFSAPRFWMGGGLESRCVGRVYGADGAVHGTIRTVHKTYTACQPKHVVIFQQLNTITNPHYHSCVFMTDIYLTISLSAHNGDGISQNSTKNLCSPLYMAREG